MQSRSAKEREEEEFELNFGLAAKSQLFNKCYEKQRKEICDFLFSLFHPSSKMLDLFIPAHQNDAITPHTFMLITRGWM